MARTSILAAPPYLRLLLGRGMDGIDEYCRVADEFVASREAKDKGSQGKMFHNPLPTARKPG